MVCVELPGISNYLRGEYRRDLGRESHVRNLSRVYRYIMPYAHDAAPVVWHVLPRAQLQSSRRAFATARRRRPGGSHLPGRATRTMRGGVSFAAAAASTAALGRGATGRRAARRRRHGTRRTHRLERVSGTAGDERPGRWPPPRPTTSSTKVRALLYLSCRVSPRAARRSTTRSRRSIRGQRDRSLPTSSFFLASFSDVSSDGDDDASTQRPIRTRARARRGGADDSSALPLARASRDDETPSRSHETASGRFSIRVGHLFPETPPRTTF